MAKVSVFTNWTHRRAFAFPAMLLVGACQWQDITCMVISESDMLISVILAYSPRLFVAKANPSPRALHL